MAQIKKTFSRINKKFELAEAYLILHGAESMTLDLLLVRLETLCRRITAFKKSL
jgi:hypothetical protein